MKRKTEKGGNPMNEATKIKEEETDVALTTETLTEGGPRSEMRAVVASSFGLGGVSSAGAATALAIDEPAAPLFSPEEAKDLRARWDGCQTSFVDEPRRAVEQADSLVATAMKRLAEMFAAERAKLEGQWDRGDDVTTEDLRLALRRYRSFFGRLLSV
jgi:hypothetical protein